MTCKHFPLKTCTYDFRSEKAYFQKPRAHERLCSTCILYVNTLNFIMQWAFSHLKCSNSAICEVYCKHILFSWPRLIRQDFLYNIKELSEYVYILIR